MSVTACVQPYLGWRTVPAQYTPPSGTRGKEPTTHCPGLNEAGAAIAAQPAVQGHRSGNKEELGMAERSYRINSTLIHSLIAVRHSGRKRVFINRSLPQALARVHRATPDGVHVRAEHLAFAHHRATVDQGMSDVPGS